MVLLKLSLLFAAALFAGTEGPQGELEKALSARLFPSCPLRLLEQEALGMFTSPDYAEKIAALRAKNQELRSRIWVPEAGVSAWKQAQKLGLVRLGAQRVEKKTMEKQRIDGVEKRVPRMQRIPFYEILMPYAHTGFYFPNGEPPDRIVDQVDAILFLLPGIGFDFSTAKSSVPLAGTYNRVLKGGAALNPGIPLLEDGEPLSVLTLPLDAPLNGMGELSPFLFGHPENIMEVLEHACLLMQILFPGRPIFIGGRSQGGKNSLQAAASLDRVAGVFAVNPSLPIDQIIKGVIKTHIDPESDIVQAYDLVMHFKSWSAHNAFSLSYDFLETGVRAPAGIFTSRNDPSYNQEIYRPALDRFMASSPLIEPFLYDEVPKLKAHDLLDVQNRAVYDQVISQISHFIIKHGKLR
ncbi:hypothetical protein K2X33_10510 [bacterium]|nr:hypothetical protein [bacterium]